MAGGLTVVSAQHRGERVLATAAGVSRLGALVLLVPAVLTYPQSLREPPLLAVAGALAVESGALAAVCLLTRGIRRWWVLGDAICLAALIWLSIQPYVDPKGLNPFYNFSVMATVPLGLAPWPLPAAAGAATLLSAPVIAVAVAVGPPTQPLWNAIPSALTFPASTTVAWVLAWLLRHSSQALDKHREAAVSRAEALAREREQARQGGALGAQLLSTLDELAAAEGVLEPVLREQVRREAEWLRGIIDAGLPADDDDLAADTNDLAVSLRGLVAEKAAAGLQVRLRLPDSAPPLAAGGVAALIGATREALTNVVKHAGVDTARVHVRPVAGGVEVEITDGGRGYDPATRPPGTGQTGSIRQRISDAGGRAEIESTPGQGTKVRLWLPSTGADTVRDRTDP